MSEKQFQQTLVIQGISRQQTFNISSFELFEVRFDDDFNYYFFAGENPLSEEITSATENILEDSPSEKSAGEFFTTYPSIAVEEEKNTEGSTDLPFITLY